MKRSLWAIVPVLVALTVLGVLAARPADADGPLVRRAIVPVLSNDEARAQPTATTEPERAPCAILGYTGGSIDDFTLDTTETPAERDAINRNSGVWAIMNAISGQVSGVTQKAIFRHYQLDTGTALARTWLAAGIRVIVIGHSAGGAAALITANELAGAATPPVMLIQLDAYDGATSRPQPVFCTTTPLGRVCAPWASPLVAPPRVTRSTLLTPQSVLYSWNFYQETELLYHGRPDPYARHNVLIDGTHTYVSSVPAITPSLPAMATELNQVCAR